MNQELFERISSKIDTYRDFAIQLEKDLIPIKALSPDYGGQGEMEKAKFLENIIRPMADEVNWFNAKDERVSCGERPNVEIIKKGKSSGKRFLLVGHMDVVPSGDEGLWETNPWEATEKDGKIYGRGSEDNHQGIISAALLLKAVHEEKIELPYDLVIWLCADEECGNDYGAKWLVKNHKDRFKKGDLVIAPDGSVTKDGDAPIIAEKGIVWIKATIEGKQGHAAFPQRSVNTCTAAAEFTYRMEKLHDVLNEKNELFSPSYTTITPTKRESNEVGVNVIPGKDVAYFDCRHLPTLPREELIKHAEDIKKDIETKRGVKITFDFPTLTSPSQTSIDSPIVQALCNAAKAVYKVEPKPQGVGAGTISAYTREIGLDSLVYAKLDCTLHNPNEYVVIDNILGDAKVFAHVALSI
ncbi:M20 family metallo-hydrolase [bacterium]|nr:M20 family metallo-hydrolase [bacterium]